MRGTVAFIDKIDGTVLERVDDRGQSPEVGADHRDIGERLILQADVAVPIEVVTQFLAVLVDTRQACDKWLQKAEVLAELLIADIGSNKQIVMPLNVVIGGMAVRKCAACDQLVRDIL